jgi:hypothetical protein
VHDVRLEDSFERRLLHSLVPDRLDRPRPEPRAELRQIERLAGATATPGESMIPCGSAAPSLSGPLDVVCLPLAPMDQFSAPGGC